MDKPKKSPPPPARAQFAQRLAQAREQAGYEYRIEFARALGVEKETYNRWERAETEPDITSLRKISQIANVSLDFLLLGNLPAPMTSSSREQRSG